jgi:hypothetical protein
MRALTPLFAIAAVSVAAVSLSAQRLAATLSGNWAYEVVTENGTGTPAVVMTQTGDSLTGSYTSGRMGTLPFKGTVKGQTFTFAVNTSGGATLTFHGTIVDPDHVKGDVDFGGQGGATFSGTRKP